MTPGTPTKLPPLVSVERAAKLAGMSPPALRRWVRARTAEHPKLLQKCGRIWRIQVAALGEALGRTNLDFEDMLIETAARVDGLERRVSRIETHG